MGVFTAAGKNVLLNTIDGAGWYAAPFNGDPSDGGTELSAQTDEGRIALNSKLAAAASGIIATDTALLWTADPSGSDITINHVGIYDADTAGNLVAFASVDSRTLTEDETLTIDAGDLDFALTDPA
jgi:hypothetical protein